MLIMLTVSFRTDQLSVDSVSDCVPKPSEMLAIYCENSTSVYLLWGINVKVYI